MVLAIARRGGARPFGLVDDTIGNTGGLRFEDEPVRHKILDAIGDLALLAAPLRGELSLHRCGHRLLRALLQRAVRSGALQLAQKPLP